MKNRARAGAVFFCRDAFAASCLDCPRLANCQRLKRALIRTEKSPPLTQRAAGPFVMHAYPKQRDYMGYVPAIVAPDRTGRDAEAFPEVARPLEPEDDA
jgi:hypothetical protein